jgi:hypothetical protein
MMLGYGVVVNWVILGLAVLAFAAVVWGVTGVGFKKG